MTKALSSFVFLTWTQYHTFLKLLQRVKTLHESDEYVRSPRQTGSVEKHLNVRRPNFDRDNRNWFDQGYNTDSIVQSSHKDQ
jgi:hypothetical protein